MKMTMMMYNGVMYICVHDDAHTVCVCVCVCVCAHMFKQGIRDYLGTHMTTDSRNSKSSKLIHTCTLMLLLLLLLLLLLAYSLRLGQYDVHICLKLHHAHLHRYAIK